MNQLRSTSKQSVGSGTPETTYYVYNGAGERVRKVTENQAAQGVTPTRKNERIYIGGFEVYREFDSNEDVDLERETLHVMDDTTRVAMVDTKTVDGGSTVTPLVHKQRYQLGNHLGSASIELDDNANVITYEEYYPFGGTSFHSTDNSVSQKRYRYTGKEKDEETGLYYHGARYYAPWLARWTAADPIGLEGGINLFAYVSNNPVRYFDPDGKEETCDLDKLAETMKQYREKMLNHYTTSLSKGEYAEAAFMAVAQLGMGLGLKLLPTNDTKDAVLEVADTRFWLMEGAFYDEERSIQERTEAWNGISGFFINRAERIRDEGGGFKGNAVVLGEDAWNLTLGSMKTSAEEFGAALERGDYEAASEHWNSYWLTATIIAGTGKALIPKGGKTGLRGSGKLKSLAGVKVTRRGINEIKAHLGKLDALDDLANLEMLRRLEAGQIGLVELRYYQHELIESKLIKSYSYEGARAAHLKTLEIQGIKYERGYEKLLYGEELFDKYIK